MIVAAALVVLAACAGNMEPAQKFLTQIQAAVTAASTDAEKYIPDQFKDVQGQVSRLQGAFDKQDYSTVITAGPAVLAAAQALAPAAAAKKSEVMQTLNGEWTEVTGKLPNELTAIQQRMEELSKRSNRKMAQGIDLPAQKTAIDAASSLWSKAQAAFASGNLDEAVSTAKDVRTKLRSISDALKM
ncbi:MAG: hypothetical protein ACHQIL_02015 [Steroidobacterales bacterium]